MNAHVIKVGDVTVEHIDRPGYGIASTVPARVVQHTTEGGFEGALAKLRTIDTPTFLIGRDGNHKLRCVQFLPIGVVAGALEHPAGTPPTNGMCVAQIELVGFSEKTVWLPDAGVTSLLASLYHELHVRTGVPYTHVAAKRDRKMFEARAGFYGHGDVPDQPAGHWDPGNLNYAEVFRLAKKIGAQPAWLVDAKAASPLWAWMIWRDHGAPPQHRPVQVPSRVPKSWWVRYAVHKGAL